MANTTIYPYGTNGQLPSSIGVINDLTTGGVDKALSAEMGKELGEVLYGSSQSYKQTTANGLHSITDDVLDPETTSKAFVGSIMLPVQAGQVVSYGPLNTYNVGYVLIVTDEQYNVLYKLPNSNLSNPYSGTYTITEDGYVVVQGWCYWSDTTNTIPVVVYTPSIIDAKADKTEIPALVGEQTELLKYTDDIVPLCDFYERGRINNGALSQETYGKYSDYIRINPSTKMIVTKVTSNYQDLAVISFYGDQNEPSYLSGEDIIGRDISTTGTEVIAPSAAHYMRICFRRYATTWDSYKIQLEVVSLLRHITDKHKGFEFILPRYVDGVSGSSVRLFTSQFMDYDGGYYFRSGGNILRVPGHEDVWNLSGETNVILCDKYGGIKAGFTQNADTTIQHFKLGVRLNAHSGGDGSEKTILFIGDSLMANGPSITEATRLLDVDGDYDFHYISEKAEGRKYSDYTGSSSAFYVGGALNFQQYMATKHASIASHGIDYVIIALGTNDVNSTAYDAIVANAKTLIDAILDETTGYPNAKIAVGLPSLGAPFGSTNNDTSFTNMYEFKRKMKTLNKRLIAEFDNGAYKTGVTCMAHGAYIYGWESYKITDVVLNDYCETTGRVFTDRIHPQEKGYKQWGYAFYCKIRAFLAGNL